MVHTTESDISSSDTIATGRGDAALWLPHSPESSRTFRFLEKIRDKYSIDISSYHDLYKWSTDHIDKFWSEVWDETEVCGYKGNHVVDTSLPPPANPLWFAEAKVNYAENMLRCRSASKAALIEILEPEQDRPTPLPRVVTYAELYQLVANTVSALLSHGLKAGDRVASYSSNCIENVAACLASSAIGCVWVSAAADFGAEGVLERFEQVQPKLIISVEAVVYNGKTHEHLPKLHALLRGLSDRANLRPKVIVLSRTSSTRDDAQWQSDWIDWDEFLSEGKEKKLGLKPDGEIDWQRLDFNWPLWILFSSGTTGRPKPIVHRAGGMLLQAKKEFVICADLHPEDVFFYYTTTGWMMWNFLVSGLSVGCTIVLYDGSPLRDPSFLWRLVDQLGITIFGTSAKYIDQLSKVYRPAEHNDLSTLRHIYSTGSPLSPPLFDFVYEHIRKNVLLGSITGGTDICSLFAGMCTALPVFRGEIQCRLLGMAVEAFTPTGVVAAPDEAGELVCLRPFPCMPVGFWPLPGYGSEEVVPSASYLLCADTDTPCKVHGDHIIVTRSRAGNGGGLIMLGRSDGVLNPGGIRFGSAEIYDVIELCFPPASSHAGHAIVDCLAVGQSIAKGSDERVILFVKLLEGQTLGADLEKRIRAEIRKRRSARHVPAEVIQVRDIPYTVNMKRVEVPVKKIINGAPISSVNPATLRNPECLVEYEALGKILREKVGA